MGIRDVIVRSAMGSEVTTSQYLAGYPTYDSPASQFAWLVLEEDARTALQQLPSLRKSAEPVDGTVLSALGDLLLEEGRIEDAIAILELNVEENPRSAITYDSLADAYLRRSGQGDRERALANYRKLLETILGDASCDTDFLDQLRRDTEASIFKLESEEPDIK